MEQILTTNFTTTVTLLRLLEKRLQSVTLDMTFDIMLDVDATADAQVKTLNLMKKWVDEVLNNSIAFCVHNEMNTEFLAELDNLVMFCPDEPNDYLLLLLVVAKLNAIGSGIVEVKTAALNGSTSQGFGYTLLGDPLEVLPSNEEWMGSKRFYDNAWWNRPDGGMMDVPMDETDNPTDLPDILIDLEQDKKPKLLSIVENSKDTNADGAQIIRVNFKPHTNNDPT